MTTLAFWTWTTGNSLWLQLDETIWSSSPHVAVSFAATIFIMIIVAWNRIRRHKPFASLPMPPCCHWLMGHFSLLKGVPFEQAFQQTMINHCDDRGRTGFWLGPVRCIALLDFKDIRTVLTAMSERQNLPLLSKHVHRLAGPKTIGLLRGKEWRLQRAAIVRSLKPQTLRRALSIMIQVVQTMLTTLEEKLDSNNGSGTPSTPLTMEIQSLLNMITIDTFGRVGFDTEFGCCSTLTLTPFSRAFGIILRDFTRRFNEPLWLPWNYFYWIPTMANRQQVAARNQVRTFVKDMIQLRRRNPKDDVASHVISAYIAEVQAERQRESNRSGKSGTDAWAAASLAASKAAASLSNHAHDRMIEEEADDEALTDTMISILVAGYDTTSISLSYTLYLIAKHPLVEAKCLAEIRHVKSLREQALKSGSAGDGTTNTATATTATMNCDDYIYIQAVFREALRLYSPFPQLMRGVFKDFHLDKDITLPKGTIVTIPTYSVQRHDRTFVRATEFHPERWVKYDAATKKWVERLETDNDDPDIIPPGNKDALFYFSAGARTCPGAKFAIQLATVTLVTLLERLKFSIPNDNNNDNDNYVVHPIRNGPMQAPSDGLPMTITKRAD